MTDIESIASRHGFELVYSSALPEIDGSSYVLNHSLSGARLLYLRNDDEDKGFSITFKTPAEDDTGVFHILEHSVLCGSEKFPVKEPFVTLLKSSMQTFLNAMTFPDKTMYPVASTNDKDLMNLADVYMDAVFHPNIYRNKRIFEQEGWHFELEGEASADASVAGAGKQPEARLVYNGVVFNEMKGALSDPDSVLYDTLSEALFPDTTYRFESGGTPEAIPTLTYENFLDVHKRHYRADNSYIVLYGNLDLDEFLAFLDGKYLSQMPRDAKSALPSIDLQKPLIAKGVRRTMATAPENACAAFGYVAGTSSDRERMVAISILLDALMGSNVSPLKHALLKANVASDVDAFLADSVLQPFVMVHAKGLREGAVERMRETMHNEAARLADGGLNIALVDAALAHAEFIMREGNFGCADGVVYSMAAMNGWLYDDDPEAATAYLRYEDVFASLREKLSTPYFHNLIREIFLDNDHYAEVEVVPVADDASPSDERARLDAIQSAMTEGQLDEVAREVVALREAQSAPDSPQALAKLPRLAIEDVGEAPHEPAWRYDDSGPLAILRHSVETHGIVYASRYFDISCVEFDELPYVSVLAMVLGKLDTARHTAQEIDTLVQSRLGSLSFSADVFDGVDGYGAFSPKFTVAVSALSQNARDASAIANEIMLESDFYDAFKLKDMLLQRKVALEQRFSVAGNSAAAARAASYYLPCALVREQLGGIDFYMFLKRTLDDFETAFEPLAAKLADLASRIFTDDGCVLSFGGGDADLASYMDAGGLLGISREAPRKRLVVPVPVNKHEALCVPTDVTYSAVSADRSMLANDPCVGADASRFSGAWMVASRILTYGYLWNEVRVMGGAYGVSFNASRTGLAAFTSYRDPHVDETLERFRSAGAWIGSFQAEGDEFEGYVVSTAASFDKPLKPRDLIRRQALMHFTGYARSEYLRHRDEVIATTEADVRALGPAIAAIGSSEYVCVVGNRDIIEHAEADLECVDLLAM